MAIRIFSGIQPVLEALRQESFEIKRGYFVGNDLPKILVPFKYKFEKVPDPYFEKLLKHKTINHQNVAIELDIPEFQIQDLNDTQNVLLLDGITDEQNLGNISRTAAFFNFQAIIYSKTRSAGVSPVVDRISAGGPIYLKYIEVANLIVAFEHLKENGFWIAGSSEHANTLAKTILKPSHHPWAIVIGNEENGISPKLLEKTDYQIKIETLSPFKTLNAATASTILCSMVS